MKHPLRHALSPVTGSRAERAATTAGRRHNACGTARQAYRGHRLAPRASVSVKRSLEAPLRPCVERNPRTPPARALVPPAEFHVKRSFGAPCRPRTCALTLRRVLARCSSQVGALGCPHGPAIAVSRADTKRMFHVKRSGSAHTGAVTSPRLTGSPARPALLTHAAERASMLTAIPGRARAATWPARIAYAAASRLARQQATNGVSRENGSLRTRRSTSGRSSTWRLSRPTGEPRLVRREGRGRKDVSRETVGQSLTAVGQSLTGVPLSCGECSHDAAPSFWSGEPVGNPSGDLWGRPEPSVSRETLGSAALIALASLGGKPSYVAEPPS